MLFLFVCITTDLNGLDDEDNIYNFVIIGAGPTGLGAAQRFYELRKQFSNIRIAILEQDGKPGGLASSDRDDQGFLWDMGGHVVFSHYEYFDATLDQVEKDWNTKQRAAYAFMKGSDDTRQFIPYPVQNNIEWMDKSHQRRSISGLEDVASKHKVKPCNFDQWLLANFGTGLYDLFMRKYNKKIWTLDPSEMNSIWVGERVAVPDIDKIKRRISEHDKGNHKEKSNWGPNNIFRFPKHSGTGGIWKAVADRLPREWFKFRHKVTRINTQSKTLKVEICESEKSIREYRYDYLISTAPLDLLFQMIDSRNGFQEDYYKALTSRLAYTHTHIIGIGLTGQPPPMLSKKSWIYFPDSDSPFYRVTVFSSYSDDHVPKPGVQWSLMCEAAEPNYHSNSKFWTKDSIIDATVNALIEYGFVTSKMIVSKYHRRLDHGYPTPSLNREMILEEVQPWLESHHIYSRGRFGGWRYEVSNQDHSFMQGVEIIDRLLRGIPEETYFKANIVNSKRNTDRFIRQPLLDYQFVVAHFNEDLDWLIPVANRSHVYHKGSELRPPPMKLYAWDKLPNVGRESHTYLYHIINNYNTLPQVTVFIQGEGLARQHCFSTLSEMVRNTYNNISCKITKSISSGEWGRIRHVGKWLEEKKSGEMRPAKFSLGRFFEELFGFPHSKEIPVCLKGCFGATEDMIKKHPLEFYRKAISFIEDHKNPEEGHYFERLWAVMFSEYNTVATDIKNRL